MQRYINKLVEYFTLSGNSIHSNTPILFTNTIDKPTRFG